MIDTSVLTVGATVWDRQGGAYTILSTVVSDDDHIAVSWTLESGFRRLGAAHVASLFTVEPGLGGPA